MGRHVAALVRRQRIVELVAGGLTPREAAERLGLSRKTVERALHDPELRALLRAVQQARLAALVEEALVVAPEALMALAATMASPIAPSSARVAAARTLLGSLVSLLQTRDFGERLAAIEEEMEQNEEGEG